MIVGTTKCDVAEPVEAINLHMPNMPSHYKLKVQQFLLPGYYLCDWEPGRDPIFIRIEDDDERIRR